MRTDKEHERGVRALLPSLIGLTLASGPGPRSSDVSPDPARQPRLCQLVPFHPVGASAVNHGRAEDRSGCCIESMHQSREKDSAMKILSNDVDDVADGSVGPQYKDAPRDQAPGPRRLYRAVMISQFSSTGVVE